MKKQASGSREKGIVPNKEIREVMNDRDLFLQKYRGNAKFAVAAANVLWPLVQGAVKAQEKEPTCPDIYSKREMKSISNDECVGCLHENNCLEATEGVGDPGPLATESTESTEEAG